MLHAKNYYNRPLLYGVLQKIKWPIFWDTVYTEPVEAGVAAVAVLVTSSWVLRRAAPVCVQRKTWRCDRSPLQWQPAASSPDQAAGGVLVQAVVAVDKNGVGPGAAVVSLAREQAVESGRRSAAVEPGTWSCQWSLSLIHIWRCRRIERCRSRWSPYH